MMIGEQHQQTQNPTVYTSPWLFHEDSTSPLSLTTTTTNGNGSPNSPNTSSYLLSNYDALLTALSRYLPSNEPDIAVPELNEPDGISIDATFANSDDFRMYEFKVRMCTRAKAHDWTECPFAHPGEKARRRDPRKYFYSGTACTDFRKGNCRRGDSCDFAHGVFECWLHPTRYRTQACKDGPNCKRRVCFFAHSPDQLRVVSGQPSPRSIGSGSGSPDRFEEMGFGVELSPLATPVGRAYGSGTVSSLVASLRNMQLSKVKSMGAGSAVGMGSPRFVSTSSGVLVQPAGFRSLPSTPTRPASLPWEFGYLDGWEEELGKRREMRLRMLEKRCRENRLDVPEAVDAVPGGSGPDIGWVSELLK